MTKASRVFLVALGLVAGAIMFSIMFAGCYGPPVEPRKPDCKDFRFVDTTARVDSVVALGKVCVQ